MDEELENNLGKFVNEELERNLGELVAEELSQQVVDNTRLCLHLAANLTRGIAPAQSNANIISNDVQKYQMCQINYSPAFCCHWWMLS